jgi:DNA repair exonuclease SbcCD ATPase subunit
MIRVLGLEIRNFLSWQSVELDCDARGVVLVLGPNGAGKSAAVSEAVSWCLFGRTIRGLRGDEVVHDPERTGKTGDCSVTVFLDHPTLGAVSVTRHRKHKKFKNLAQICCESWTEPTLRGPEKTLDPQIQTLLGLSWETFRTSCIFGQGQLDQFSTGTDAQRKAVLDEMLQLDRFVKARDRGAEQLRVVEAELGALQVQRTNLVRLTAAVQGELASTATAQTEWEQRRVQEATRLRQQAGRVQATLDDLGDAAAEDPQIIRAELDAKRAELDAFREGLQQAAQRARAALSEAQTTLFAKNTAAAETRSALQYLLRQREQLSAEVEQIGCTLSGLLNQVDPLLDEIEALGEEVTHHCPTCKVDLEKAAEHGLTDTTLLAKLREDRQAALARKERAADALDQQIERLEARKATLVTTQEALVARIDETEHRLAEGVVETTEAKRACVPLEGELREQEDTLAKLTDAPLALAIRSLEMRLTVVLTVSRESRQTREALVKELADTTARAVAQETAVNPYTVSLAGIEKRALELRTQEDNAEIGTQKLTGEANLLRFWVDGFGPAGIRSLLLDEILPALNRAARRYAHALSDGRLTVRFDTETQLKSGESRDKFAAVVELDHGSGTYAGCSGGWQRRADLVELLALRSVTAGLHGGLDLLVLDEPLTHVDSLGAEQAVRLVQEVAKDLGTVFLATHDPEFQAFFPQRIAIAATAGVSRLEVAS